MTFTSPVIKDEVQNYAATLKTFTIEGEVRDADGNGVGLVFIRDSLGNTVATTNADGTYSFTKAWGWSDTVTPYKNAYSFTPPNRTYTNLSENQTGQDYTASIFTYTISGRVYDRKTGLGMAGISIFLGTLPQYTTVMAVSNEEGYYSVEVPFFWSGTLYPDGRIAIFKPLKRTYIKVYKDYTDQNYAATFLHGQYTISGRVATIQGHGLLGVQMKDNTGTLMATTDKNGLYSFWKPDGWSGTITPYSPGKDFTPSNRTYTNLSGNQTNQNYTEGDSSIIISGTVYDKGTIGLPGVKIFQHALPQAILLATTDNTGYYSFEVPFEWSGTVYPDTSIAGFTPPKRTYYKITYSKPDQDYHALAFFVYTISGRILLEDGTALEDVQIKDETGATLAVTDNDGYYSFTKPGGWSGMITPFLEYCAFIPSNISYDNLNGNQFNQDYQGMWP